MDMPEYYHWLLGIFGESGKFITKSRALGSEEREVDFRRSTVLWDYRSSEDNTSKKQAAEIMEVRVPDVDS